jgi:hypothetical protein
MKSVLHLPDDLGAYAEARVLARMTRAACSVGVTYLLLSRADELCALLGEAMQADDAVNGLKLLRDANQVLEQLRRELCRLLCARSLPAPTFDDLMNASSRCRSEIDLLSNRARHRAWMRLQQGADSSP